MRTVGIFEAKAKLSEICEEVASSGRSVMVTRRGKPLVKIDPVVDDSFSVWEDREQYIARKGHLNEEFDLPSRSNEFPTSPLED